MKKLLLGLILATIAAPTFAETRPFKLEIQIQGTSLLKEKNNAFENIKSTAITKYRVIDVISGKVIADNLNNASSTTNIEKDYLKLQFIGDKKNGVINYSSISRTNFLGDARKELEAQGEQGRLLAKIIIPLLREGVNELTANQNVSVEGDNIVVKENEVISADVKTNWRDELKSFTVSETEMTRVVQNSTEAQSKMIALLLDAQFSQLGMRVSNLRTEMAGSSELECKKTDKELLSCSNISGAILTMDITK